MIDVPNPLRNPMGHAINMGNNLDTERLNRRPNHTRPTLSIQFLKASGRVELPQVVRTRRYVHAIRRCVLLFARLRNSRHVLLEGEHLAGECALPRVRRVEIQCGSQIRGVRPGVREAVRITTEAASEVCCVRCSGTGVIGNLYHIRKTWLKSC